MTKTASFALVHFSVAFSVGYAMTGSVLVGGAIALVEPAVNTVAYFFHEKLWERIGQRTAPQFRCAPRTDNEDRWAGHSRYTGCVDCVDQTRKSRRSGIFYFQVERGRLCGLSSQLSSGRQRTKSQAERASPSSQMPSPRASASA